MTALLGTVAYYAVDPWTAHGGETVIVLMPWVGWGLLRIGLGVRGTRAWWWYAGYGLGMAVLVGAGIAFLTASAGATLLWGEVFWASYFAIGLRLVWAVWRRMVESIGRRVDPETGQSKRAKRYHVLSACLTALVFGPMVFGFILHHPKLGNNVERARRTFPDLQEVSFKTADGLTIRGWFIPDGESDTTVMIVHGLGANKTNFLKWVEVTHGFGYNGLIFDLRGHGDSDGHTTTFGLHEWADVVAAVDWLKRERPERAKRVYGIGSSMGAMSLVRAAAVDDRIDAIVLDSAFVGARRFLIGDVLGPLLGWKEEAADALLALGSLHAGRSFWALDAVEAIRKLDGRPVLLIHGRSDFLFHPSHMEELYEAAGEPKEKWLADGMHSNILTADPVAYRRRVLAFFSAWGK